MIFARRGFARCELQDVNNTQVNTAYFYSLLFTRRNLKLVHIVCHDKQEHLAAKCDTKMFFSKKNCS